MRVFATSSKISIYVVENILRQNIFQEILEFIFFCAPGIRVFAASRHSCMFEVQNILWENFDQQVFAIIFFRPGNVCFATSLHKYVLVFETFWLQHVVEQILF